MFDENLPADPLNLTVHEIQRLAARQVALGEEQTRDAERFAGMVGVLSQRAKVEGIVTGSQPATIGDIATPEELRELERLDALTDLRAEEIVRLSEYLRPLGQASARHQARLADEGEYDDQDIPW